MQLNLLTREDLEPDIITISPTQLKTWFDCRYKWKLAKIDGVDSVPVKDYGAAQNKGRMFHSLAEWYYGHFIGKQCLPLTEKASIAALNHLKGEYEADKDFYQVYTIWLIYCEWAAQFENIVPLAVERECFAPTGLVSRDGRPIYLHGLVDLIGELDSKLVVEDHKSHTNKPWTEERLNYDHQFIMYVLMLELQGYTVDLAVVNTVNLFISTNSDTFRKTLNGVQRYDRFTRFYRNQKTLMLKYHLDNLLRIITEMWVNPKPDYEMRLTDQCQFCSMKAHIQMEAEGQRAGAVITLKARHNTDTTGFDVEDDTGDMTDNG